MSYDDRDTWNDWDFTEGAPGPRWNERPVDPRGAYRPSDDGPPDPPERSEAEDERQYRIYRRMLDRAAARDAAEGVS